MQRKILSAIKILKNEGVILYPTDTVWGIGCDATDEKVVEKIFNIKQRSESKSLIILVDSLKMLSQFLDGIPESTLEILKGFNKPTTVIYENPIGLAKNVIAEDNTVAIRIVKNDFCKELIKQYGKPIVSTSANISGKPTPKSFKEIDTSILDAVDYVVNLHQNKENHSPSKIIKFNKKGEIEVIRA